MRDEDKSREQLLRELAALRERETELADALQQAESRLHNLFEGAGDSILLIDPVTIRIVAANQNASRRLGYTRDELSGLTLDDIQTPRSDDAYVWRSVA
ncbi:MAG: PAS domain-containing protein, partial [Chloroflexi bacterium]|nr:PAS domain-containing protein [Chloroflexota bacterium]